MRRKSKSGFTLIELSIVLVIIGLLVGGVLVGRDLIRAAAQRAVVSEVEAMESAVMAFRSKYNCLPGDCANATTFWGTDPDGCSNNPAYRSTSPTGTCNGDGNGRILWAAAYMKEFLRFWQHLANSGLTAGAYTGTCPLPGSDCVSGNASWVGAAGVNVPNSKWGKDSGYCVIDAEAIEAYYGGPLLWSGNFYGNTITLGRAIADVASSWFCRLPGVDPLSARAVDAKMDDGLPKTGKVQGAGGAFTAADGTCISSGTYANGSAPACWMVFKTAFQ